MACAAKICSPRVIDPERAIGPSQKRRTSDTSANGLSTRLQRLLRVTDVDHVVKHDAAVGMDFLDDVTRRPQAGDNHRHLVPDAERDVVVEPIVGVMHDLVHGEGSDLPPRFGATRGVDFTCHGGQPFIQQLRRPRVERRKGTYNAGHALRQHQLRLRDDEHRRTDHGQHQIVLQDFRKWHGIS